MKHLFSILPGTNLPMLIRSYACAHQKLYSTCAHQELPCSPCSSGIILYLCSSGVILLMLLLSGLVVHKIKYQ